ncbi:MAG TPA: SCO family protein [Herpetosiphonaceae bacterium]
MKPIVLRLLATIAALVLVGCGQPYQYTGTELNPPKPVADFTLTDQHGQPFQLSAQRGNVTLLYFGYTNCPDFCPTTMGDWKQVKQQLGSDAEKVRFALISVDPQRDTEQALKQYLDRFDPSFVGLRPTPEQLEQLSREYGAGVDTNAQHGALDPARHSSYVYVIDPAGQLRLLFSHDVQPQQMADDIRHLLRSS